MSTFEQLLSKKKKIEDNIKQLKQESTELEQKIENLYTELEKTKSEIGELRHVNMNNDLINMAHSTGKRVYYCDQKICITEYCEKGRELSDFHKGGIEYIDIWVDDHLEAIEGLRDPHRLYFMDGETLVLKEELKLKFGCKNDAVEGLT